MKELLSKLFVGVSSILLVCFISCAQGTPSNVEKIGFEIKLPGNSSRTAYYSQEDAASYLITVKKDNQTVTEKTGLPGETVKITFDDEGTYDITINAYDEKNTLIAEGSKSVPLQYSDGIVSVTITLIPKEKPEVGVDIDIDWADPNDPTHVHTFAEEWSDDGEYHYHASTCGHTDLVKDKGLHSYGDDNICSVCGLSKNIGIIQKSYGKRDIFYYNDISYDSSCYGKWDVREEKNESITDSVRCVKLLLTRHTDITGRIDLDVRTISGDGDGVLGAAFDVTKGINSADETTWNFGVVGIAYDSRTGKARYYVSHFFNITDEDMSKNNFGCYDDSTKKDITKTEYDPNCDTPYEVVVNGWTSLDVYTTVGDGNGIPKGRISVVVQVKEDDMGDYVVNFYDTDGYNRNANTEAGVIAGCAKITSSNMMAASKIGKTGPRRAYVGVYCNIYTTKILNGSLEICDITN